MGDAKGIYLDCRLSSDDEPERRVWKVSIRTEASRGEFLYQAEYKLPKPSATKEWSRIQIPFQDFQGVSGARLVEGKGKGLERLFFGLLNTALFAHTDAAKVNVTGGLYQIGLSMSKFVNAPNRTEIENFRPGYFELQVKGIGLYTDDETETVAATTPKTLTKKEVQAKRPMMLKVLLPVLKLFFSEQA